MEMLAVMCEHLFELPAEWRGPLSLLIYKRYLFPLLHTILSMEEDDSIQLSPALVNRQDKEVELSSEQLRLRAQSLTIMSDVNLLKSFVLLGIEVLNYALEVVPQPHARYAGDVLSLSALPLRELCVNREELHWLDSLNDSIIDHQSTIKLDQDVDIWPSRLDGELVTMFVRFYRPHMTTSSTAMSSLHQSVTREVILSHMTMWYALSLRFECGLRGVSVSALVGGQVIPDILQTSSIYGTREQTNHHTVDAEWRQVCSTLLL
jgi:hypothetical protein